MHARITKTLKMLGLPLAAVLLIALPLISGCSDESPTASAETPRLVVSQGYSLAGRVEQRYQPLVLESPEGGRATSELPQPLTLVGELSPPTNQSGVEVRATCVAVEGDLAYVGYNREGDTYAGAVEVIDISDPANPEVVSQALFDDMDVAALALSPDGAVLAIAGARDMDLTGMSSPAVVEEMALAAGMLTTVTESHDVPSYVANGVVWSDEFLAVSSGNSPEGGIGAFDRSPEAYFDPLTWNGFVNAQYLAADEDRIVALQVGDSAGLHIYDRSGEDLSRTGGFDLDPIYPVDGKNTMVIDGDLIFVAMGEAGVAAYELPGGTGPVHTLARPVVQPGGQPDEFISNSVALDEDYLYVANGAGGLYVACLDPAGGEAEIYGRWDFGSSANFVTTDGELVFVASGTGGLKILQKNAPLMNEPAAEWRLDEALWTGAADEVIDQRGQHHGRAMGDALSIGEGLLCRAGRFDGEGDYVDLGPVDLDLDYALTVCAWVRWEEDSGGGNHWANIVSNNANDRRDQGQFWIQHTKNNDKYEFCVMTENGRKIVKSANERATGEWQHVAGVFEGDGMHIYVDGQLSRSKNVNSQIVPFEERYELRIGSWAFNSENYRAFTGDIDEVMVLSEALAPEQILEIYENQRAGLNADGSERVCP